MKVIENDIYDEVMKGDHYRCVGSVRGWCGVRHQGINAANRCRERDGDGCASQGGYSDRQVYLYQGDELQGIPILAE